MICEIRYKCSSAFLRIHSHLSIYSSNMSSSRLELSSSHPTIQHALSFPLKQRSKAKQSCLGWNLSVSLVLDLPTQRISWLVIPSRMLCGTTKIPLFNATVKYRPDLTSLTHHLLRINSPKAPPTIWIPPRLLSISITATAKPLSSAFWRLNPSTMLPSILKGL